MVNYAAPCELDRHLGAAIRRARRAAGYSSPEAFCEAIELATGRVFSRSLLLTFERGEQALKVTQLLAICETLRKNESALTMLMSLVVTAMGAAEKETKRNERRGEDG